MPGGGGARRAPRIIDPRAVPVAGVDSHLPAVAPQRLTPQALRERFARTDPWQPERAGDGGSWGPPGPGTDAAVLVALVVRDGAAPHVLLTRRTEHLRDHAGQIAFPGGRSEPEDGSAAATALREAHEEVGLDPARVEVIGQMPVYTTVTGYRVTPVVGLVQGPLDLGRLVLDPHEVAAVFEVPLAHLMDPGNHRRHVFAFDGGEREFLSMPWPGFDAEGRPHEHFIWGATAAMLRNLYRYLSN